MNRYGDEISYDFRILKVEDFCDLQPFECGNEKLDYHIHNEVIKDGSIIDDDGLYFVFTDLGTKKIIGVVSLSSSGIIYNVDKYTHVLPAIKIDVLAIDKQYQKIHYDLESEKSKNPDDHYYFSDELLCVIIKHCRKIAEKYALASYIILYADQDAYRYYERNNFKDYSEFMIKEKNQEINKNIPMYMQL